MRFIQTQIRDYKRFSKKLSFGRQIEILLKGLPFRLQIMDGQIYFISDSTFKDVNAVKLIQDVESVMKKHDSQRFIPN